jgi:hypothetical protein
MLAIARTQATAKASNRRDKSSSRNANNIEEASKSRI